MSERWSLVEDQHTLTVRLDPGASWVSIGGTPLRFHSRKTGAKRGNHPHRFPFEPVDVARARLIAAAPELADALSDALAQLSYCESRIVTEYAKANIPRAIKRARAALKAAGR